MTEPRRIFFPRPTDAANSNAQAKNAQNILRHWRSPSWCPVTLAFGAPDPLVAANPAVDIIRINPDHLWRVSVYFAYFHRFAAVFCPGVHHYADWLALKTRRFVGCNIPVIGTLEGLLGSLAHDDREQGYSNAAGHQVYCQKVPEPQLRRAEDLLFMSAHIIAISPFLGRMAKGRYGDKVSVLPLGVDTEMFSPKPRAPRRRPRVVGAGRVEPHKRPELFVSLAARFPEADFVWIGDGEQRERILREVCQRKLSNIALPGAMQQPDLASTLGLSDIFVLPSLSEGVPKVTQEAAAAGLAQIIFGFYEAPSVIDGVNGFVVWSDEELIERLGRLIADGDLVERMGRAGRRMAEEWSWASVAPQWVQKIIEIAS